MSISLVKGKHAANCPCRICKIAREVIFRVEESRFQETPEQPNPEAINGIEPVRKRGQLNSDFPELMDLLRKN